MTRTTIRYTHGMAGAGDVSSAAALTHGATVALQRLAGGDAAAAEELLPLVYDQLRGLAGAYFQGQAAHHTLQPTALVHEAYLKLVRYSDGATVPWKDRAHFLAVAATAMRQILRDRARAKRAAKRGGPLGELERITLDNLATPSGGGQSIVDMVALDDALQTLAELDPRQSRIVELRFFGGLTNDEVAQVLGLSTRMIEKEWRRTRAWLSAQLSGGAAM